VSNPPSLRLGESFELVAQLKETIADFAKREELVVRELRTRRQAETRQYQDAMSRAESSFTVEKERIEIAFAQSAERARAVFERRKARIDSAENLGRVNLREQAKRAKERWLGKLQMRHFTATRNLPLEQAAEERAFARLTADLAGEQARLGHLEKRVKMAMGGYFTLVARLRKERRAQATLSVEPYAAIFEKFRGALDEGEQELAAFQRQPLPRMFSYLRLWLIIPIVLAAAGWLAATQSPVIGGIAAGVAIIGIVVLHHVGWRQAREGAERLIAAFVKAERLWRGCGSIATNEHEQKLRRLQSDYDQLCEELNTQWANAGEIEKTLEEKFRVKIEMQGPRARATNERLQEPKIRTFEGEYATRLTALTNAKDVRERQLAEAHAAAIQAMDQEEATRWHDLETEWTSRVFPFYQQAAEMNAVVQSVSRPWSAELVEGWTIPTLFPPAAKFGSIDFNVATQFRPKDPRLALPAPAVSLPLALTFPTQASLLFETHEAAGADVANTMNNIILRLLATTPPGKLSFTIIDPAGLGQNFAGLMHLSDFEESLINRRIWTQREQIEERLAELSEHIEKVIQMYLRNEYATITEYNAQAGSVAEKYHFLVVADFPANFSESAAKRLQSIVASGPRCGVFTMIHWDRRQPPPDGFVPDELGKNSIRIRHRDGQWNIVGQQLADGADLLFDTPPPADLAVDLVHKIGQSSIDSNRVEVPFAQVAPRPEEEWKSDTTNELKVAIGRTGATKLQYLAIGKGTRQHALFAGKTGSGKSTLFHVIITNLALSCSPAQVEFYLIDFKKGVEFKCYATHRLPHARVVAIESDREFGLSVLRRVDDELKRRGDIFRKLGVQDIPGYKRVGGKDPMPRTLLMIDEFQEFFVEDDEIAQNASLLFDRIVRQGRAFGIHVLLGSQTLGGAYTLARATLGQMVIRVALQCNEADAYLIMDENNPAPRLLSRPGEGIYNDSAGAIEGNSPFQVVWLPDEERDLELDKVRALAERYGDKSPGPIVFEGNAPADVEENYLLRAALEGKLTLSPGRAWLGAPNSIKGPTEVLFRAQSGSNLLVVGQRDEAVETMLGLSLTALAAQYSAGAAKLILIDAGVPGDLLDRLSPEGLLRVANSDVAAVMNDLSEQLKTRSTGESLDAQPIFVFIHDLQKFKKLRQEDDFDFGGGSDGPSPSAQLNTLLVEGPSHGIHFIVTIDTYNNVSRFLSRKALSEFEMRVVFQMSANDSSSLIDSPQASGLGLHRALFYNERDGSLETFRPYAVPEDEWIKRAVARETSATTPV